MKRLALLLLAALPGCTAGPPSPGESLPPPGGSARYAGRWAQNVASCSASPWLFRRESVEAEGRSCRISNVRMVPGGYDALLQCGKEAGPITLRFAESAKAMLVESSLLGNKGLIFCGSD